MRKIFSLIVVLIMAFYAYNFVKKYIQDKEPKIGRTTINYKKFRRLTFNHQYTELYPLPKIENLKSNGNEFLISLEWRCLTDAVEDRYNLPSGFIFAMVFQESSGIEFLLNLKGDGGAGLCHMQPPNAQSFGLKTFKNCDGFICDGKSRYSCIEHGQRMNHAQELLDFIKNHRGNRALLAETDERLDHLKNLDAVGRMLAYDMDGPLIDGLGPLRTALRRYTGTDNYEGYWRNVKKTMNLLQDSSFMKNYEQKFNAENPHLLIDGAPGNFQMYLESYCRICDNYGLSEYKLLPKYLPRNSELVKKTYKNFL